MVCIARPAPQYNASLLGEDAAARSLSSQPRKGTTARHRRAALFSGVDVRSIRQPPWEQVDHGSVFGVDDFGQEASERKALGQKHTNDHVFRGGHHDDADDVGEGASGEEGPQSAHRLQVAYGLVSFRHLLFQPAEHVPADDDTSGNTHIDNRSDSKEGHDLSVVDRPHVSVLKVEAAPVEEAEADERGHGDSQQVGPVVQEPTDRIPFYHGGVGHAQVRHARMILVTKGQQRVVTGLPRDQVYRLLPLPHDA